MKKLTLIFVALLLFVFAAGVFPTEVPKAYQAFPRSLGDFYNWLGPRLGVDDVGDVWYVNGDISVSAGGESFSTAFKTISEAISRAGDDDVIFVAPGDYEEGDPIAITQNNLKIFGPGIDNQNVAMILVSDSSNHAMTINANNVEIAGLGFTVNKDTYSAIMVSTTASKYKTHIHHCRFDGYGQGEYAVHTGTTYDSPDIVVEHCVFRSWQTAAIYANATRGIYRNNVFLVDAAKIGIEVVPTTSSRSDQVIKDNVFRGANSTDTGIKITNSPNENALTIDGNKVYNCATPITESKYTSWYDGNYLGVQDGQYHSKERTLWVDANITTAGDGKSLKSAFKTLTAAEAAASTDYTIMVEPGDYEEGDPVTIDVDYLKIIGPGIDNQNSALIWTSDSSNHLMVINANGVEIAGLGFTQTKDTYDAIRLSTTASKYKIWIHDCRFDGYGQGEYAIHTGSTYDSPDLTVENCVFRSWQTAAIYGNATRGHYRNNLFHVPASAIGFELVPDGGNRPDQVIDNNLFLGANSSDVGIKITNTPTALYYLITRNLISGCATTITAKATNDAACILNYTGDAAGGALINPSP